MKTLCFACVVTLSACQASDFINLTFDDPDLSGPLTQEYPDGPFSGNTSQILRGWEVLADGVSVSSVGYSPYGVAYNVRYANLAQESLPSPGLPFGQNDVFLNSPHPNAGGNGPELRLKQVGTIPGNATGLSIFANGPIQMYINGDKVGQVDTSVNVTPTIDVSAYAGQTVDLEFLVETNRSFVFDIGGFVTAVPEPSTWALFGLGGLALSWSVARRRAH